MAPFVTVRRKRHKKVPSTLPTGPTKVKVGFPSGEASGENISKAVWNEFGTRGGASGGGWGGPIPERPFMRNTMRDQATSYRQSLKLAAKSVLNGSLSLLTVMQRLGIKAVGDIQAEITALRSPPNSPVTVAMKGSSNPLIDTGEMRQAVTYKVDE